MIPNVLIVSTWDVPCGVSEYAAYWVDALTTAEPKFKVEVVSDLHPHGVLLNREKLPPIVVLNYQAALLSQWHPEHIQEVQHRGSKVFTIWHDSGVPNTDHCKAICGASNSFALHEPFDDLPRHGHYIRHGVPEWEHWRAFHILKCGLVRDDTWWASQPVVGSVGLSNQYRNHDLLCKASALAGWGALIIAPNATDEEVALWTSLNPAAHIIREFLPRHEVVSYLAGCTAVAYLLVTNNAGVSGSVRQGIASRQPILAFRSRILRDLENEPAIRWIDDGSPDGVAKALIAVPPGNNVDYGIVALAAKDSWANQGRKYAEILRGWL